MGENTTTGDTRRADFSSSEFYGVWGLGSRVMEGKPVAPQRRGEGIAGREETRSRALAAGVRFLGSIMYRVDRTEG
jgi:hypothetical protein